MARRTIEQLATRRVQAYADLPPLEPEAGEDDPYERDTTIAPIRAEALAAIMNLEAELGRTRRMPRQRPPSVRPQAADLADNPFLVPHVGPSPFDTGASACASSCVQPAARTARDVARFGVADVAVILGAVAAMVAPVLYLLMR